MYFGNDLTVFFILGMITPPLKSMAKLPIDFRGRQLWSIPNERDWAEDGEMAKQKRCIKETSS